MGKMFAVRQRYQAWLKEQPLASAGVRFAPWYVRGPQPLARASMPSPQQPLDLKDGAVREVVPQLSGGVFDRYLEVGHLGTFDTLSAAFWVKARELRSTRNPLLFVKQWKGAALHFSLLPGGQLNVAINGNSPTHLHSLGSVRTGSAGRDHVAIVYDGRRGRSNRQSHQTGNDHGTPRDAVVRERLPRSSDRRGGRDPGAFRSEMRPAGHRPSGGSRRRRAEATRPPGIAISGSTGDGGSDGWSSERSATIADAEYVAQNNKMVGFAGRLEVVRQALAASS